MFDTPLVFVFVALFLLTVFLSVVLTALFLPAPKARLRDQIKQAADADAACLLDYLQTSKHNLYFNPTMNAWGLVDGSDHLLAAGNSVRAVLSRSRQRDADVQDELSTTAALDFSKAELN